MENKHIAVEFIEVNKSFNKELVLSDITLSLISGETYFLYGETAAGKTTFLKLLTRQLVADSGIIKIFGDNISLFNYWQTALYRRELGVVWQDLKLIPKRTVFENVALPLVVRGMKTLSVKEKVNEFLASVGLFDIKDKFIEHLSYGTAKKVATVRALITQPKLIIADEPLANVDNSLEKEMQDMINKYKIDTATVIWVTNQKYVLEHFPDKVIILENGKIKEQTLNRLQTADHRPQTTESPNLY